MMHGSWDIKCKKQSFLSFWAIFCPLTLLTTQRVNIFKNKKMPEDIILLHLCTTNDNHGVWFLIYQAWQTEFFVILGYFLPFSPLTIQKIKVLKNRKKLLEVLSFTQVYHKWQSYYIWFLRYQLRFFCHLWPFLALLPH